MVAAALTTVSAQELPALRFEAQTVDDQVAIGYGIALEDVDGDGRRDILLADKRQFVWYRNPQWERFVLAENLTEQDNVCLAARDIDGDGRAEIAVGAQWNPGDTVNSGSVHYLVAPQDRTKPWTPIQLHHEPVVHRMRWVKLNDSEFVLVVAPLHGRGNRGGQGAGVRLLAYYPPEDPTQTWRTELLDDVLHVTHNFDIGQWIPPDAAAEGDGAPSVAEEILYIGREGALLIQHDGHVWKKQQLAGINGGGEIRMGRLADGSQYIVTIEPFHGDQLVFHHFGQDGAAARTMSQARVVVDDNLQQGHAIATGDLLGTGYDQIVAGWREPNSDGMVGLKWYGTNDGKTFQSAWIDQGGMACEDARIADLDGDGKLDVVAAGRSTHNLKVYWNRGVAGE